MVKPELTSAIRFSTAGGTASVRTSHAHSNIRREAAAMNGVSPPFWWWAGWAEETVSRKILRHAFRRCLHSTKRGAISMIAPWRLRTGLPLRQGEHGHPRHTLRRQPAAAQCAPPAVGGNEGDVAARLLIASPRAGRKR